MKRIIQSQLNLMSLPKLYDADYINNAKQILLYVQKYKSDNLILQGALMLQDINQFMNIGCYGVKLCFLVLLFELIANNIQDNTYKIWLQYHAKQLIICCLNNINNLPQMYIDWINIIS